MCNVIRYQPTECSSLFVFSSSSRTRASFLCFPSLPRVALRRQTHAPLPVGKDQFGNRYFEQLDWEKEIPGRHRWVDYSQVSWTGIRPVAIRFGDTDRERDVYKMDWSDEGLVGSATGSRHSVPTPHRRHYLFSIPLQFTYFHNEILIPNSSVGRLQRLPSPPRMALVAPPHP